MPKKKKKQEMKEGLEGISPGGMQARRRQLKKHRDDLKLYQMIQKKEFDLFRKEDLSYVGAKARKIDWSRGRFEKALNRIWSEAKRDIAIGDKSKVDKESPGEAKNDEQQN